MDPRLLRLVYVFEFLLALVAIFTSWSEIGGQAALDLMHWGWKLGLGLSLAASVVAYTASVISEQSLWTLRSARWLTVIVVLVIGAGIVTYFYSLQTETTEPDDGGTVSWSGPPVPAHLYTS